MKEYKRKFVEFTVEDNDIDILESYLNKEYVQLIYETKGIKVFFNRSFCEIGNRFFRFGSAGNLTNYFEILYKDIDKYVYDSDNGSLTITLKNKTNCFISFLK